MDRIDAQVLESVLDREHALRVLSRQVIACRRCPRLVEYRAQIARDKRRAFEKKTYWGRPVPGLGDPEARLLIVGLAPAAHGANRTGRNFTGDGSGDFLFAALHRAGFANQPTSRHRGDGLALVDCYIAATVRCAPPANKPLPQEIANCSEYLDRELALLADIRVIVALGRIAFDNCLAALERQGMAVCRPRPTFGHGRVYRFEEQGPILIASYHPSRRNTQTGLLTRSMFDSVFARAKRLLTSEPAPRWKTRSSRSQSMRPGLANQEST
jgi:uracil-DNA glycosylase family 4